MTAIDDIGRSRLLQPPQPERMFDILTRASAKMQILILTCREDLFARLGGNPVEVAAADRVFGA